MHDIHNISNKYKDVKLIPTKQILFDDVGALLDELDQIYIHGKGIGFNTPTLDMEINNNKRLITITYQNINECIVNYYIINTEILFSLSPFTLLSSNNNTNNFMFITPKIQENIQLPQTDMINEYNIPVPNALRNQNFMIQIISDSLSTFKSFYDNELIVQVNKNYGILKVSTKSNTNIISIRGAYIKVYYQTHSGLTGFYKDGYTDLLGNFDYLSISSGNDDELNNVNKFAIFIQHNTYGNIVIQTTKPTI
mmetsp:Transcript_82452/g.101145  ORF Transcript_82452/g.101145 Transcript_82452/m.101145 type:complete len:252 (-) Transcript_82452:71-826(-)